MAPILLSSHRAVLCRCHPHPNPRVQCFLDIKGRQAAPEFPFLDLLVNQLAGPGRRMSGNEGKAAPAFNANRRDRRDFVRLLAIHPHPLVWMQLPCPQPGGQRKEKEMRRTTITLFSLLVVASIAVIAV